MGEVVQADPEIALRIGPEHLVEFAGLPGLRIGLEELVAQERAQFGRGLLQRDRLFQDLEDARLVAHLQPALLFGGLEELGQFTQRPLGFQVARRDDGDENGDAAQPVHQRFGEQIVAGELRVTPDMWRLTEKLRHADFEGAVEVGHPALPPLDEFQIVEMRVTDERVAFEVHVRRPLYVCATARTKPQRARLDVMRKMTVVSVV